MCDLIYNYMYGHLQQGDMDALLYVIIVTNNKVTHSLVMFLFATECKGKRAGLWPDNYQD